MTSDHYDLTAELYDGDMGLNAPERSVDWYLAEASHAVAALAGPVLELGCGTGRVTLPLAAAGLDVVGVDRSLPMLAVLSRKLAMGGLRGAVWPVVMDMARLGLRGRFATVLCPYSAFGYLVDDGLRGRMLQGVRALLADGGPLLLDAFVPDPELEARALSGEVTDYQRELPPGLWAPAASLVRSKRLFLDPRPGVRRVRRRYRFLDAGGRLVRELQTDSVQRVYGPGELASVLEAAGFTVGATCPDFDAGQLSSASARTVALVARRR